MDSTVPALADEAAYEAAARVRFRAWRRRMLKPPTLLDKAAGGVQGRINRIIPDQVHAVVTAAIEAATRTIILGAHMTTARPLRDAPLSVREAEVRGRIAAYRAIAAAEGGVAGAGGFALAAAELPTLLATKIKLLFDIAALYGHDVKALSERLFILTVFHAAFSGAAHRAAVVRAMAGWDGREHPQSLDGFDWRRFQIEYRDYIDLAKMAQLIPMIGAPVGVVVNYRLVDRLGEAAIAAYRMRWFEGRARPTAPAVARVPAG
jgi:hypothetical protein